MPPGEGAVLDEPHWTVADPHPQEIRAGRLGETSPGRHQDPGVTLAPGVGQIGPSKAGAHRWRSRHTRYLDYLRLSPAARRPGTAIPFPSGRPVAWGRRALTAGPSAPRWTPSWISAAHISVCRCCGPGPRERETPDYIGRIPDEPPETVAVRCASTRLGPRRDPEPPSPSGEDTGLDVAKGPLSSRCWRTRDPGRADGGALGDRHPGVRRSHSRGKTWESLLRGSTGAYLLEIAASGSRRRDQLLGPRLGSDKARA